jgi:NAD(P)-dependent dehydrogenase (short-subunit alcohol dehydrogenase family)
MKNEKWTTDNIPDLSGKTIIVTGGSSGLGFESVKVFAKKGATVIIASRTIANMEAARQSIIAQNPKAKLEIMELNLADLDSVRKFTAQFKKRYDTLDILMNNAGVMTVPYESIKNGTESQFNTNHLGHFALTGQLIDVIKGTPNSRVVVVSSLAYKAGKMDFDYLNFQTKRGYSPMKAYGRAKLANLIFAYELQRRFASNNIDSVAVAAHPGLSLTNLGRHIDGKFMFRVFGPLMRAMIQNADTGAYSQIRAATDPNVKGGEFFGPNGWRQYSGSPVLVKSNRAAQNTEDAKKLWEVSENLTGVSFGFNA